MARRAGCGAGLTFQLPVQPVDRRGLRFADRGNFGGGGGDGLTIGGLNPMLFFKPA